MSLLVFAGEICNYGSFLLSIIVFHSKRQTKSSVQEFKLGNHKALTERALISCESTMAEFTEDVKDQPLSMHKVEWCLLKYSNHYKKACDARTRKLQIRMADPDFPFIPFPKDTDLEIFLSQYEIFLLLSERHRNEWFHEQEMIEYAMIKDSSSALKRWTFKNKEIGVAEYFGFFLDYFERSEDFNDNLTVLVLYPKGPEILIDRQYFKHSIEFIETFDELYYVREMLPERLERDRIEAAKSVSENED